MNNIPMINFKVVKNETYEGEFEIAPLVAGFGHSIGNALKRTLISSTKGAAITKVQIEGVTHQFTTIEGAKDDVLHMLLNFKKVRIKKDFDETAEVRIDFDGPGDLTASHIQEITGIEVANKDLVITSLSDKKSKFKAKLTIESGYRYKDVEEREEAPLGVILLDAIFSPIINVIIKVEPTRVGRDTNFDKLTLKVSSNGTVNIEESVREAAKVLKEFFYKIQTGEDYKAIEDENIEANNRFAISESKQSEDEILVDELRFPTRTVNALKKAGIRTLKDLLAKREDELFKIRNLGEKSIREILAFKKDEGLE